MHAGSCSRYPTSRRHLEGFISTRSLDKHWFNPYLPKRDRARSWLPELVGRKQFAYLEWGAVSFRTDSSFWLPFFYFHQIVTMFAIRKAQKQISSSGRSPQSFCATSHLLPSLISALCSCHKIFRSFRSEAYTNSYGLRVEVSRVHLASARYPSFLPMQ